LLSVATDGACVVSFGPDLGAFAVDVSGGAELLTVSTIAVLPPQPVASAVAMTPTIRRDLGPMDRGAL
jgi:hypothetical protein